MLPRDVLLQAMDAAGRRVAFLAQKAPGDRDIDAIIADFTRATQEAVQGYMDGGRKGNAERAFLRAIGRCWPDAAFAGYEDGGGDIEEIDAGELQDIDFEVSNQEAFAQNFWDDLPDIRDEGREVDARVELYASSLRAWYNRWRLRAAGDPALTFRLGDAKEHCERTDDKPSCPELDGQRHRWSWWQKRGIMPGQPGSATACGGWLCQCYFENDKGEKFAGSAIRHGRANFSDD